MSMNSLYGHEAILRQYCRVKLPYVVPGILEHGWEPSFKEGIDKSKATPEEKAIPQWVLNERNLKQARAFGYKVEAIGAPILYMEPVDPPEPRNSTLIVFPSHSLPEYPFMNPNERFTIYLNDIKPLIREFQITVCLYWHDYDNPEVRQIFEGQGLKTVTAGHREDNNFLYTLRSLICAHSYMSSNEIATAMIYALYWRRKAFMWGTRRELDELHLERSSKTLTLSMEEVKKVSAKNQQMYPELYWQNFRDKAHCWIGDYEVGVAFKRSPEELRELLGWEPKMFVRRVWPVAHSLGVRYLPSPVKSVIKRVVKPTC